MDRTGTETPAATAAGPVSARPLAPALRFALRFGLVVLALYAALYYPYDAGTLPVRVLEAYVRLQAFLAGNLVRIFDRSASVTGDIIGGRFSLAIVLDCAAIDAQALFTATVIAFPAPWKKKLLGFGAGIAVITAVNLVRIAILYFVGAHWPRYFTFLHEDLFQFGIIAAACAAFAVWAWWVTGRFGRKHATA